MKPDAPPRLGYSAATSDAAAAAPFPSPTPHTWGRGEDLCVPATGLQPRYPRAARAGSPLLSRGVRRRTHRVPGSRAARHRLAFPLGDFKNGFPPSSSPVSFRLVTKPKTEAATRPSPPASPGWEGPGSGDSGVSPAPGAMTWAPPSTREPWKLVLGEMGPQGWGQRTAEAGMTRPRP